jgi:hypothetical protein
MVRPEIKAMVLVKVQEVMAVMGTKDELMMVTEVMPKNDVYKTYIK